MPEVMPESSELDECISTWNVELKFGGSQLFPVRTSASFERGFSSGVSFSMRRWWSLGTAQTSLDFLDQITFEK
jgi:hypothetical protein